MKTNQQPEIDAATSAPNIILLGLCVGLLTGFGEVLVLALHRHVGHRWLQISMHYIWMVPVVNMLVFGLCGGLLSTASALFPRVVTWRRALGILAFGGWAVIVLRNPWIHWAASLLLACGLALQTVRLLAGRPGLPRGVVRTGAALATVTLVIAAVMLLYRPFRERRALARLAAGEGTPNVLLIVLDTVRALELSLYGYDRPTTPNIDAWAQKGVVMDRALSPTSWTLPSHASIFTGLNAAELDVGWDSPLQPGPVTLAETMTGLGYATAGFVGNRKFCSWETGLGRGFLHYEDYTVSRREALRASYLGSGLHGLVSRWKRLPDLHRRTWGEGINQSVLSWIDQSRGKPFFVFINYLDAHEPYSPPEPYRTRFGPRVPGAPIRPTVEDPEITETDIAPWKNAYDGALAYLDQQVGNLLRELEQRGLLNNTLVVLTADHGEEFGEHGMRGHAVSLYQPSVHVPLVFSFPGRIEGGRRVSSPVAIEDIPATVLDLLGQESHTLPGQSMVPRWTTGIDPSAVSDTLLSFIQKVPRVENLFPAARGDIISIAAGTYRYIWYPADDKEELFDFSRDVWETTNLVTSPEVLPQLSVFRAEARRLAARRVQIEAR